MIFGQVAGYESLGNVFKWGELTGAEAKEKVMEEFSSEGGKVWVNYNVDNGEIKITAFGMYQVAPEDEETEEDQETEDKEEKPSGYFKKMELINGQMVETSENPNKK